MAPGAARAQRVELQREAPGPAARYGGRGDRQRIAVLAFRTDRPLPPLLLRPPLLLFLLLPLLPLLPQRREDRGQRLLADLDLLPSPVLVSRGDATRLRLVSQLRNRHPSIIRPLASGRAGGGAYRPGVRAIVRARPRPHKRWERRAAAGVTTSYALAAACTWLAERAGGVGDRW